MTVESGQQVSLRGARLWGWKFLGILVSLGTPSGDDIGSGASLASPDSV